MGFTIEQPKKRKKRKVNKERQALIGQMQGYGSSGKGSRADRGGAFMHDRWARRSGAHRKKFPNPDPTW